MDVDKLICINCEKACINICFLTKIFPFSFAPYEGDVLILCFQIVQRVRTTLLRQNMLQNFSVGIIIVTFTEETHFCCLSSTPTRRLVNFHPQEIRTIETHDKSNRQCKITIIYGIRKSNEDQISNIFDNLATFPTKITQIVV